MGNIPTSSTVSNTTSTAGRPWRIRRLSFLLLGLGLLVFTVFAPAQALAQTKALKLYYLHTGEKAEIVFKRNGRFVQSGLKKINWFLRDWRRNEPTKMDPNLLDLVWEVYRKTGSRKYIHVISGYRSPASNAMLRKRGRGVAKNSQHTRGKAMDFFIPGVKLSQLRALGLKMEVGGVGYYPSSGSPFVHFDTGRVRHWPRMSRKQLARVFPKGKTMHVPSDGKPLARYKQAVAAYKKRTAKGKLVPQSKPTKKELNFFQKLAKRSRDNDDESVAGVTTPRSVKTTTKQVKPKVEPTPKPLDTIKPEVKDQIQIASLPKRIPVPVLAPRKTPDADEALIAKKEAEKLKQEEEAKALAEIKAAEAEAKALAEAAGANDQNGEQSDSQTSVASLNIPVPTRRPGQNPTFDIIETDKQTESNTSELALAADNTKDSLQKVAALTDDEIFNLRATARQISDNSLSNAPTPTRNPVLANAQLSASAAHMKKDEAERLDRELAERKAEKLRLEEQANASSDDDIIALPQRTVSLDRFSAPQNNKSVIGKWALASDTTITDLSDVQPPAYGRNVIRQVKGPIILQGFKFQPFGPGRNQFKGKAVQASKFAEL